MKAKDIMIPLVEYLKPDTTLKEAVNILKTAKRSEEKLGVKGLPVLDESGALIGMLALHDIMKAVFPYYMTLIDVGELTWDGMLEEMARKLSSKPVGEVMSSAGVAVTEEAPLMECVDHMIRNNVTRLPVLNHEKKVVGMVYERDVFDAITEAMKDAVNKKKEER